MISKLEAMMSAFQEVIGALKPQETEIEVEVPATEAPVEEAKAVEEVTAPKTDTIVEAPKAITDTGTGVPAVTEVASTEIAVEACGDKPKEEAKAEATPAVEPIVETPKPAIEIKVLRKGAMVADEKIKAKALKFIQGKPF